MADSRSPWSTMTPLLVFSSFCLLVGDMLFGYDTGSYGGILVNPGFVRQFGKYDPKKNTYAFDSIHTSLMSSIAFAGKLIGCLAAGPLIEKYGHRIVFFLLSVISAIGVIIEITASDTGVLTGRYAQYVIGRIIVYVSVGLVEVTVTTYQSEIVPAPIRGLVVISLQLFLSVGTLVATGINKAFSLDTSAVGWKTVTGIQFVFPALIALFTFFIPSSPRWLLSKDREEDAVIALRRLRPKADSENGSCDAEIHEIREALHGHVRKAPWIDLVRGKNFRRTMLVMAQYFFQQATGQAFISTYQTTFYATNGYASQAFTYPIINSCISIFVILPGMALVDKLGRRYTLLISLFFQSFFMYLLAGLGHKTTRTTTDSNAIVAALMLFAATYNLGGGSIPYLLGSEIPTAALREKTQAVGTAWNVLWAFVTNFAIPHMISAMHFEVGWVFGSIAVFAFLFTFFLLPETKGRTLEEIDAVFEVPFNPFRPGDTTCEDSEGRVGRLSRSDSEVDCMNSQGSGDKPRTIYQS